VYTLCQTEWPISSPRTALQPSRPEGYGKARGLKDKNPVTQLIVQQTNYVRLHLFLALLKTSKHLDASANLISLQAQGQRTPWPLPDVEGR